MKKSLIPLLLALVGLSLFGFLLSSSVDAATITLYKVIYSSSSDGYLWYENSNYTDARTYPLGTVIDTLSDLAIGQSNVTYYRLYRCGLYFPTSNIPDAATIINTTLSFYCLNDYSDQDFNITIQNGQPTYPHDPMVSADYDLTHYSGNGGEFNTTGISVSDWNNITLTSEGESWIDLTGTTKLVLRSNRDISSITPAGDEYVGIAAMEDAGADHAVRLIIWYSTEGNQYILNGAYDEDGYRDGAINCTLYRETEAPYSVELDGQETITAEEIPIAFKFDLGYNETRTYYLKDTFEEIFVIKPSAPWYQYAFTVIDYLGVSDAYLESLLNINGTDRIVERWELDLVNDIPFTFSWGTAYKLRLICNRGTYYYPDFVAGATTSWTLTITSDMFPETPTDISNVTVWARRLNYTHIQALYDDNDLQTVWIYMAIHDLGNLTHVFTSTNTTGSYLLYNWYEGDVDVHYYVNITVDHEERGIITWAIPCPIEVEGENPWDDLTTLLGTFPFDPDQLFAVFLIMCFVGAFSWKNYPIGIIIVVIIEILLTWMGWLSLSWTWLTIALTIAIVISMAEFKERMRTI